MNTHRITFVAIALVAIAAFAASMLKIELAQALADATSSTTTVQTTDSAATTSTATTSATTTAQPSSDTTPQSPAPAASPTPLTVVHIIGTKYIDYCTDGTKVTAYPGDPTIDSHFNVPDAPTPKCPSGQKWDHTSGMNEYDTTSGDLEVGDYARQTNGTYTVHYAATTYRDATSTSQWPDRIVQIATDPTVEVSAPPAQN